jgi:osmoprotectant transport system substrate-binding protein
LPAEGRVRPVEVNDEGGSMVRKHMRRAAKAAFAIALGVPLVLGGTAVASHTTATAKPTIVVGTKNFPEQYILGQLYKQALQAKGFKVGYKENIGSSELIDTALTSGKINFYPEYTGVIVQDLAHKASPKTAGATFVAAKRFEEKRGYTLLNKTPFYDSDAFGTLASTAKKYNLKTIADVKKVSTKLQYGGFPECQTRITCFKGLTDVYGLTNLTFVPLSGISIYTAMDDGKVDAGDVFTTDPQLASGKYTVLKDPKNIFGFQNIALVIDKKKLSACPHVLTVVNKVNKLLTTPAIIAMNKAAAIDKQQPATVAAAFLKANNLG